MNDQHVHPLIRYGGPLLGAIILYFVLSTMIGNFQAEQAAIRQAALGPATVVEEVEGAEPAAEQAAAEDATAEQPVAEEAAAEVTAAEEPVAEEAASETPEAGETPAEAAPATESAVVDQPASEPAVEAPTATPVVLQAATIEVTPTVTLSLVPATPVPTDTPAPTATPVATPAPSSLDEMTPEQIYAGLPAAVAEFFPDQANAQAGEQLALTSGCTACHSMQPGVVQVGPSWYGVADRAVIRVPEQSPALYLYTSVTHPNDYVVEGFQPNLMPQIYEQTLTAEQMANLIAYLLTLREE